VYALAATFYHLLTGCMPLSAADRAVQDTLEEPRALNQDVSAALSAAVMHGLAVRMDERPQTMAAFAAELRAARAGQSRGSSGAAGARQTPRRQTPAPRPAPATQASAPPPAPPPPPPQPAAPPDPRAALAQMKSDFKQAKREWREARQQARRAEHDQRHAPAAVVRAPAAPAVPARPDAPAAPAAPVRRRLPRPLPQNARELVLYALATPGAAVVLVVSLLTLICASPLLALATLTSRGATRRVSRQALRRSARLGAQGVVLGTVCIGSLVVVAVAVAGGVVLVPLYALVSSQRRRPRRTVPGLRQP
jgi:outer membrane biosynthesis protein TonB